MLCLVSLAAAGDERDRRQLLFHAESIDGTVLASQQPDRPFNPASVVKVATSLWALEQLGAAHRYTTVVGFRGLWDRESGLVDGQLVFEGWGDPDFQLENVFLVARELNRLGVRRVSDGLVVSGSFTIGWEQGAERRIDNPRARSRVMARRLRAALDPVRWDHTAIASWEAMCQRRGWDAETRPSVAIAGGVTSVYAAQHTSLVHHHSNPLPVLLHRFNVYSNNDIIRVADGLGGVAELASWLRERVDDLGVELETASGEGRNRMCARTAVRLLREFRASLAESQLAPARLLPVPGCDPGPVPRMFPTLSRGERARSVAVKTGTLRTTDNGVAVLAGTFDSPEHGVVLFCVARPDAGKNLKRWRRAEEQWLLDLMTGAGGAVAIDCAAELPFSDTHAEIESTGFAPVQ